MKKIAVGDLGAFWYGDYKEPFEQQEGAVPGYPRGTVLVDDVGKVLCAYCGKAFDHLPRHVRSRHGLTGKEYKRELGLLKKSVLVSETVRKKMQAHAVEREARTGRMKQLGGNHYKTPPTGWGWTASAEQANKRGQCAAQLLERTKAIYRERGRLTRTMLEARGIRQHRVGPYFGSFDKLIRMATGAPLKGHRWDNDELVSLVRNLANELGHTPTASDVRRYGLPPHSTYINRFGSWANACRRAGLEPNLPPARPDNWDQLVLTTYATFGNSQRTSQHLHTSGEIVLKVLHRYGFPFPPGHNGPGRKEWAADMARRLASVAEVAA